MQFFKVLLFLLGLTLLTGCVAEADPTEVVEAYFRAIIADETSRLPVLTCAAYESNAQTLATSFRNTGAELQDMTCQSTGTHGDYNIVTCQGKIVVQYQAELREFPLSSYRLIQEDNTWRMCGEAS